MKYVSRLLVSLLVIFGLSIGSSGLLSQPASAANAADFNAGRLIDDTVFTNKDAMTIGQIQAFLNEKVPTCDTWHAPTNPSYQPPYICLKEFTEHGKSAAQIIWEAGQTYTINPQVILVMLQKEQSLVTDTWPWSIQYRSAMGMGCPDTAPCDAQYYGFTNQVMQGTRHLRGFFDLRSDWYIPFAPGNNYIQWHPNAGCGGTVVNIHNRATSSLYSYTPYQPNAAALNNLYGTGDGCSAYGNRNFWRIFTDWFGSTHAPSYAWTVTSQYAFSDATKTTGIGLANMAPGQRAYVGFKAKNLGNTTWTNSGANPVRVGTLRPTSHSSAFYDSSTWLGYGRPVQMQEASVAPGQTGTFEFWITAPTSTPSMYHAYFGLLAEGKDWMPDIGLNYNISVQPVRYTWQLTSQYAFTDATKTVGTSLANMQPGQRKYIGFTARNTGNTTWSNTGPNPLGVGTSSPRERPSSFQDPTWLGYSRPVRMLESSVAPGQTATFEFWVTARSSGNFNEYFNLVLEGKAWLADIGFNYAASVIHPIHTWKFGSQYAYSDSSKTTPIGLTNLSPGQTAFIGLTAINTSNVTWTNTGNHPLDLGTSNPIDRSSALCSTGWLGCNRPARMIEASVAPGQTATFEFNIKAPMTPGTYREYFLPVVEGIQWMPDIGLNYYITVQ